MHDGMLSATAAREVATSAPASLSEQPCYLPQSRQAPAVLSHARPHPENFP